MIGFSISGNHGQAKRISVELDDYDAEMIQSIHRSGCTMTDISSLVNTATACRYVVNNNIPGDFVECGVWRGGHGILAKLIFERMGSDKTVWMFDTFAGMAEPGNEDVSSFYKIPAIHDYLKNKKETHNEWCYASLEDVQKNCVSFGIDPDDLRFVKGDVCETLSVDANLPSEISILRLDTDWYESTKMELDVLYPVISEKGVLIVDDYGTWEGCRLAVDKYFQSSHYKPLLQVINGGVRSAIKG